MDALYPAIVTSWGRDFDAAEISIETWGTFTLDWAGRCTEVDFSYDSIIEGYGSSQRSYISLSKLAGTTCP
jgi:hypothetical protein